MDRRTTVRRLFISSAIAGLLLTGCEITEPIEEERLNIRGEITDIRTEGFSGVDSHLIKVLVEEDPSMPLDGWMQSYPNVSSRKVWITVTTTTEILRQVGEESPETIGLEELSVGSIIRAWNTGFVVETLPPQAYAERIIVVSPAP